MYDSSQDCFGWDRDADLAWSTDCALIDCTRANSKQLWDLQRGQASPVLGVLLAAEVIKDAASSRVDTTNRKRDRSKRAQRQKWLTLLNPWQYHTAQSSTAVTPLPDRTVPRLPREKAKSCFI